MFSKLIVEFEAMAAFVKRDIRSRATYKLNLVLSFLNTSMAALTWSFLGQNAQLGSSLAPYGGSFMNYLIVGVAFNEYMIESLKAVQKSINPSELEEILSFPVRLRVFIVGNVLWGYLWHGINILVYFAIGILLFGLTFGAVDLVGVTITLVLGIAVMLSFSLLASGILIVSKQGDVIQWLLAVLATLFAGVYFPVAILPAQLQIVSWILPQTYFFELIRLSLNGHSLIELQITTISSGDIFLIGGFAAIISLILVGLVASSSGRRERGDRKIQFFMLGVPPAAIFMILLTLTGIVKISIHPLLLSLVVYTIAMVPFGYMVFKKGLNVSRKQGTLSHV